LLEPRPKAGLLRHQAGSKGQGKLMLVTRRQGLLGGKSIPYLPPIRKSASFDPTEI